MADEERLYTITLTGQQVARVMNGLVSAYSPSCGEWRDEHAQKAFGVCIDAITPPRKEVAA